MALSTSSEPEIRWDLTDLYAGPADPQIEADFGRAEAEARAFANQYRGKVGELAPEHLLEALRRLEAIHTIAVKPHTFAWLAFSAQTDDPVLQALVVRAREATTETSNHLVFFDVELKAMPDEAFNRFLESSELESYHHYLRAQRKFAPHTLSEPEERLYAQLRLTGASAWSQLYTEVTSALRFRVEVEGEIKELTDAETRALRSNPDRDLRRRSGEALYSTYAANSQVLNYAFNTLFQDHKLALGLRHYQQPIEPTALENEISPEVIESLLTSCEGHYHLAQEYYRLKAKLLGLDGDFRFYDVLAPYTREERHYRFAEGRELVLEAFGQFHPTMRSTAEEFFANRWIDAMPRPGKRGGAFCSGIMPAYHPYVLTNFTSRLDDVFTVAHELGHGVHFSLSRRQTPLNYDPPIPMAEIASVFAEILLSKYLRERETDPALRRQILGSMIEDAIATIFRQAMYTRWEQRAHLRRAAGVAAAQEYSGLWMEENRRLYGDAVRFEELDRWGWISIPHFVHYRFYCYSYAFGHLLTFTLYRKYLDEGPAFVPGYLELLASGGRDRPEEMLKVVGLNPLEPGFWERGFDVLRSLLDEFKAVARTED